MLGLGLAVDGVALGVDVVDGVALGLLLMVLH